MCLTEIAKMLDMAINFYQGFHEIHQVKEACKGFFHCCSVCENEEKLQKIVVDHVDKL